MAYRKRGPAKPRANNRGKNLVKTPEGFINEHGVRITLKEKKALESAVNQANRKRKKILEMEASLPRFVKNKPTGQTMGDLQDMGYESDFVLRPKTKSLQRFKTRKDFDRYMGYLKRVNTPTYLDDRMRLYKANHMTAILEHLGDKGIVMKIRMMKLDDYIKTVQQNEDVMEIHYVYGPDQRQTKINQIREALGMKILEEPPIDSEIYG